jgi:hypothetical protein
MDRVNKLSNSDLTVKSSADKTEDFGVGARKTAERAQRKEGFSFLHSWLPYRTTYYIYMYQNKEAMKQRTMSCKYRNDTKRFMHANMKR